MGDRDVDTTGETRGNISITFELFVLYVLNILLLRTNDLKYFVFERQFVKVKNVFIKLNFSQN